MNELLSANLPFQQFYSVIDGDVFRPVSRDAPPGRLFVLPVYHVENFLLDDEAIFSAVGSLLRGKSPYKSPDDARIGLEKVVLGERHLAALTKAHLDARISVAAKEAYDDVYSDRPSTPRSVPGFRDLLLETTERMKSAVSDGTWRKSCKGREVLRGLSHDVGVRYEHLRNVIIEKLSTRPAELDEIMRRILS